MSRSTVLNYLLNNNKLNNLSTDIWGVNARVAVDQAITAKNISFSNNLNTDIVFSMEEKINNPYNTNIISENRNINFPPSGPSTYLNQIDVLTLTNVTIHNWHGWHVVFDSFGFNPSASSVYAPLHFCNELTITNVNDAKNSSVAIAFMCFDDSDPSNYCHFMLDYLTKIAVYKCLRAKLTILMPKIDGHSFQTEAVMRLQLDGIEILSIEEGVSIKVDRLFYIGKNSHHSHPAFKGSLFSISYLRRLFLVDKEITKQEKKMLWINRSKSRSIKNQEKILEKFSQKIDVFDLDKYPISIAKQAQLFASYSVVIGPHGAGFTNIIFMDNDQECAAIECFAEGNGIPTFAILCPKLNIKHYSMVLNSSETGLINYPDMFLNESDFELALERINKA